MFTLIELIFIGIALAVDCFTVSLASGIALKSFKWSFILCISLSFGFFQALMPIIGWETSMLVGSFIESIDHWIAFALLAYIGIKMITENGNDESSKFTNTNKLILILTLSIATSIDALAVGVTFTCVGYKSFESVILPIVIIGLISILFAILGHYIGIIIGRKIKFPIEICGGIMLILIGVKILFEHLL